MSLSPCTQCKNYSEEVCLLGQSYADVFSSIQGVADEQERQRLGQSLASCAYWEESDLSKLFSQEVTLSYHAWNRLAYMKLQNGDQELFQNLVNAARDVILQHRQAADPLLSQASDAPVPQVNPVPIEAEPQPPTLVAQESTEPATLEASQPEVPPIQPPVEPVMVNAAEDAPLLPDQTAESALPATADAVLPTPVVPMPTPVNLPPVPPLIHPEVASSMAADPVEVAMQELLAMATSSSNGAHHGSPTWDMLDSGRGTGRIDPAAS